MEHKAMTVDDVAGAGEVQIGQELSNVGMGELLREFALGIARGQFALDKSSMVVTEIMSGNQLVRNRAGQLLNDRGEPSTDVREVPVIRDSRTYFGYDTVGGQRIPRKVSMMELGFTPTFYQFVDTIIEIKIAIRITKEATFEDKRQGTDTQRGPTKNMGTSRHVHSSGYFGGHTRHERTARRTRTQVTTTPVNARYASKFNYSALGSSLLRTKLVPVPPPAILEERVRQLLEQEQAETLARQLEDEENAAETAATALATAEAKAGEKKKSPGENNK